MAHMSTGCASASALGAGTSGGNMSVDRGDEVRRNGKANVSLNQWIFGT